MSHSWLHYTSGGIFGIVSIVHLVRIILSWQLVVAGWVAPLWISYIGFLLPGLLAIWLFKTA